MYILGLLGSLKFSMEENQSFESALDSGWYHNSSAALLKNGHVIAAIEEERLTRIKEDGRFPLNAIKACLEIAGIQINDVDFIAYGEEGGIGPLRDSNISTERIAQILCDSLSYDLKLKNRIRLVEHHIGHAMSAYGPSAFDEALIFTSDGFGDGISGLIMEGQNGRLGRRLLEIPFEQSLGRFYSSALKFLGYKQGDEYKMMGLAPYGNVGALREKFASLYKLLPEGQYELLTNDSQVIFDFLLQYGSPRRQGDEITEYHRNIAAGIQFIYEEICIHVLQYYQKLTGLKKLCMAGGTAQNSSLNGKLLQLNIFENIFVQPASHDAGIALGAALQVYCEEKQGIYLASDSLNYWGADVPAACELETILDKWSIFIDYKKCDDIILETSELLVQNKIIGWVQGRSEFGPRALGNRSILADPRPIQNKDRVNRVVKNRESYRPFAPAVPFEDAERYFILPDKQKSFPYMTFVVPVDDLGYRTLNATTHIDKTSRIQTVVREDNYKFWLLLKEFGRRTGTPVLLNTSFNNNNEPIVDSVEDAIKCFITTGLDALIIGDFCISKIKYSESSLKRLMLGVPEYCVLKSKEIDKVLEDGSETIYFLLGIDGEEAPISKKIFNLISQQSEHSVGGLINKEIEYTERLAQEIMELWSKRLITVRPIE